VSKEAWRRPQTNWSQRVGVLLRELREERTLTLRNVGEHSHISLAHLSEVERGVKTITIPMLEHWANGLGMKPSDLLIELGFRLAEVEVPDSPEELLIRDEKWQSQYSDLIG